MKRLSIILLLFFVSYFDTGSALSQFESKTLVVYFSRTGEQYGVGVIEKGNTEIVAEMIAEKTNADLFEVIPEVDEYPSTYTELTDYAKAEQHNNSRPAYIKDSNLDLSKYDTIFVGAPVWWGDWPMIMYSFFENENLSGKTLYPFSTHAGSGLSGFDKKLSEVCVESYVGTGISILGADAQTDKVKISNSLDNWLISLINN